MHLNCFEKFCVVKFSCEVVFGMVLELVFRDFIILPCIFFSLCEKINLAHVSHCLSLLLFWCRSKSKYFMTSDFCQCRDVDSSVQLWKRADSKIHPNWNVAMEDTKTKLGCRPQKSFLQLPLKRRFVCWAVSVLCFMTMWLYCSLTHDVCNLSAQVHQDGFVCACHDREQNSHHRVWHSSVPRPLQKYLLQVTHKPKYCRCQKWTCLAHF